MELKGHAMGTWIFLCVLIFYTSDAIPTVTTSASLVVSTPATSDLGDPTENENNIKQDAPTIPKIYDMNVETNVSNRYAKTIITSKVKNLNEIAREATFSVVLPDQAFISGFTMEIDGKSYEAYIQEKEEAKKTYEKAVSSGQSAGHVAVSARDSNRFTVSVNIEPQSKVVFYLRYEELLSRKNEKYEILLNIHPGQPVKNLKVQVNIVESRPLKFVKTPSLRSGNEISKNDSKLEPEADINRVNETSAVVTFTPNIEKQKQLTVGLGGKEEDGLSGQFVVQYDVERDPEGGEVLVDGGYFVHFFAPDELPALPKQVVFVLDTSGSMDGIRISQLKQAMDSILGELKQEDIFSIVEFSSVVKVWNLETAEVVYEVGEDPFAFGIAPKKPKNKTEQVLPPSFPASSENIKNAKEVVKKFEAYGGTDIQTALKIGLKIVKTNEDPKSHQPILIFLTDGEPTVGVINGQQIISTITELNTGKVPIFSLSFGDGADRDFLQKISLKNQGFARHIYEAADAYLQLHDFYRQISSPLLSNVTFKYVDKVANVTRTHFPILFRGGEVLTAGIIDPGFAPPAVEGWGIHGPIVLTPKVYQAAGNLEKLWAFLTVKQILEQRDLVDGDDKKRFTEEALKLALKYSFVTDVSSLVVVKPNDTSAVDTEDASKSVPDYRYPISSAGYARGPNRLAFPAQIYRSKLAAFPLYGGAARPQLASFSTSFMAGPPMPIDAEEALIAGGPISTPFLPSSTSEQTTTVPNVFPSEIAWMTSVVNDDGDITLGFGTYNLGLNETVSVKPPCNNAPHNFTGFCSLVLECTVIHLNLTDLAAFSKYFCEVEGYGGVCCPQPID
ncbi:inter-alpha-trypsin inhibitor heavy chain H4-like isoform X3 [Cylas formicarius]|uniref:inter-alpha-trypsin inhibitor heavy chain H4-like isoform X3 n=1 Tax=Cylas formicarius TaxID=197179 RepID=UPI0029589514|nr:inter-alpha-trypsin inhibitor heavy chain H4-like isoform X3 [Cylas formicarius]